MLPEDDRRPKHVGAFKYFSVCFLNTENISACVGFFWKIEIEMHGATMKIQQMFLTSKCFKYQLLQRATDKGKEVFCDVISTVGNQ
jgi:hypothetical protein